MLDRAEADLTRSMNDFPNDANGDVFRRMVANGDDLTKARTIDFCFVFQERKEALLFAGIVNEQDFEVCISYNKRQEMWQVIIKRHMVPTHKGITALEHALTTKAKCFDGEADGWGCFNIPRSGESMG